MTLIGTQIFASSDTLVSLSKTLSATTNQIITCDSISMLPTGTSGTLVVHFFGDPIATLRSLYVYAGENIKCPKFDHIDKTASTAATINSAAITFYTKLEE